MGKRILQIIQRYPPALGGSEAYFQRLSKYLSAQGHQVTVWTTNGLDLESFWSRKGQVLPAGQEIDQGVEVRRFPLCRFPWQRWILRVLSRIPLRPWQCKTFGHNPISRELWNHANQAGGFDLVHAGCFPYAFPILAGQNLARRLAIPFLLTPFLHLGNLADPGNQVRRGYTHPALAWLARRADAVFSQTAMESRALVEMGLSEEKVFQQGMGVQVQECTGGDRLAYRKHWGIGKEEVVVGHLANLSWDKGSTDLLQAAELLWKKGSAFRLILAGPRMPSFSRELEKSLFKNQVILPGVLTEKEKRDFFASLDLFALPSRSDSFGIVLLEAWANGIPCVVYNAGGPGSLVQHQSDGLVAPCDRVEELGQAIQCLVQDSHQRKQMGEAGKARALTDFSWGNKLQLVEQVMEDLLRQKRNNR